MIFAPGSFNLDSRIFLKLLFNLKAQKIAYNSVDELAQKKNPFEVLEYRLITVSLNAVQRLVVQRQALTLSEAKIQAASSSLRKDTWFL